MYDQIFYEKHFCPEDTRYDRMQFRRAGKSGLSLPLLSMGLYHFFGKLDSYESMRETVRTAFENGIFHFDVADCYGPPNGEAEHNLGRIIRQDFMPYRDELVIATKGGFDTFLGPNGEGGSRKHIFAAIDRSLQTMQVDHVDIYYHHVEDISTPLEETAEALSDIVHQGKALYLGISNYGPERTKKLAAMLKERRCPLCLNQCEYNMLKRDTAKWVFPMAGEYGFGIAAYVPLAQGLLTEKYLAKEYDLAQRKDQVDFALKRPLTSKERERLSQLNQIAAQRGQTLAQMALAWCLVDSCVSTVLIGCRNPHHIRENLKALDNLTFSEEEVQMIDRLTKNFWESPAETT